MSSTNTGPAQTQTQNLHPLAGTFNADGSPAAIVGPGGVVVSRPFDPSIVAITGGVIQGALSFGPCIAQNTAKALNYRKAFAKVLSGQRARLLLLGDSTTVGAGAGTNTSGTAGVVGARAKNYPSKLAAALTALGIPAYNEAIMGEQSISDSLETYAAYDPRLSTDFGLIQRFNIGSKMWTATAAGKVWNFTPAMIFDRFDVYYPTSAGRGSLTAAVDGGATLATISEAGATTIGKTTVTCVRGTHTINLTTVDANLTEVYGVVPWDSTVGGLDIIQGGWFGGVILSFASNSNPWTIANASNLAAIAPDLAFVQLTINDANAATDPTSYATSLATLDAALAASGAEVVLMSGIPSNNVNTLNGTLSNLVGLVTQRASAQGRVYADLGARCGSYAAMSAAGWMFDNLHGNAKLYADEGYWLAKTLMAEAQ